MKKCPLQRRSIVLSWLSVIGVTVLLIVVFTYFAYNYVRNPTSFNSDHLYCIHFCDDVLQGRDIQGWHLPAAPYFFPDMLLVLISMASTSKLIPIFTLYHLFYYGLLLTTLIVLLRSVGISPRYAFLVSGLGLAFLLAVHLHPRYDRRSLLMFHPGNHMGCLLVGLAVLAYVLRSTRYGYRYSSAVLFVASCTLAAFSDQLLIVQFLAPLSMALLLFSLLGRLPYSRALVPISLMGLSTLLAMTTRRLVVMLGLVPMKMLQKQADQPRNWSDAFSQFFTNLWDIIHVQPLMCLVFVLNGVGAGAVLVLCLRRRIQQSNPPTNEVEPETLPLRMLLSLFFLLSLCCSVGAVLVTGNVQVAALVRYLHTCWLLPYLCLLVWTNFLPWRFARAAPWVVVAIVMVRLAFYPEVLHWNRFTPRYQSLTEKLDDLVRKHGQLRGVAEYWHAREMHYLTSHHVSVAPIVSVGRPWFHGFNPNAYLNDDPNDLTIPDYHFVIVTPTDPMGPNPEQMVARYGKPLEIIDADGYEIWRYERLLSTQWNLFLRAQLAQRLVRRKPFLVPAQPETLRVPKANLTPWEDRRNVLLQRDSSLTIHFDKIVTGAMINLSANYSDQYNMIFLNEGRELGAVRVPSIEWTGAEEAYCPPGLQSRLVPVPPNCQAEGFNEVRLVPRGRSQHFSIGHFLVLEDWVPYQSGDNRQRESYHRYEGEQMNRLESPEVSSIEEADASNGRSRRASAGYQGCMAYGPYTILRPGRYRIDFALKVAENTSSDTVAFIDSTAYCGEQCLQTRALRGTDFSNAKKYQVFSLTLDVVEELDMVEYRVIVPGKTAVTLDYVDVTLLTTGKEGEACEP